MSDPLSRTALPLPPARPQEGGVSAQVVRLDPPQPDYTCSVCASAWPYPQVRNTGRCPACGSGLLRDACWL